MHIQIKTHNHCLLDNIQWNRSDQQTLVAEILMKIFKIIYLRISDLVNKSNITRNLISEECILFLFYLNQIMTAE